MRLMTVCVIRSSPTTRIFLTVGTGVAADWALSFDSFSPRLSAPACPDVSFIRYRVIKPNGHQGNQIRRLAPREKSDSAPFLQAAGDFTARPEFARACDHNFRSPSLSSRSSIVQLARSPESRSAEWPCCQTP